MRFLIVSVLVAAAAACTSPRTPAIVVGKVPAATPRSYPAPLYAGLFVKGSRHTYTVDSARSYWDDQDPRADKDGNIEETFTGSMTCTVTEVHVLPSAIASRIECDNTGDISMVGDGPAGIYVATADGLWSVPEIPRVAPTTTKDRLFAWPPVEVATGEPDPQNPGWGTKTIVSRDGVAGWCRYFSFISGDAGDAQLCVSGGIITSGSASSDGGASYEMSYALSP